MTSIVLSNRVNEGAGINQDSSIYNAWQFRNNLQSNMVIPPNSQIALQSVKINLDGTISISRGANVFYYLNETNINLFSYNENDSKTLPIYCSLPGEYEGNAGKGLTTFQVGQLIQNILNTNCGIPNQMGGWEVSVDRDSGTNEFKGFKYKVNEYNGNTNHTPSVMVSAFTREQRRDNVPAKNWVYTYASTPKEGTFTTSAHQPYPAVATSFEKPLSLINGEFIVDFSDANGKGMDWSVGLSRMNEGMGAGGYLAPNYFSRGRGGEWTKNFFCDFVVYRENGILYVGQCITNPAETQGYIGGDPDEIYITDFSYGLEDVSADYDIDTNTDNYVKVKFKVENERMAISLIDNTGLGEDVIVQYRTASEGYTKAQNLKPISLACKCLYPVLHIETEPTIFAGSLKIETFTGCELGSNSAVSPTSSENNFTQSYDDNVFVPFNVRMDRMGMEYTLWNLETRDWNDMDSSLTRQIPFAGLTNVDQNLATIPYFIVKPTNKVSDTTEANMSRILGFDNKAIVDTFSIPTDEIYYEATSITIPSLVNTRPVFVRLDNMPTNNVNAFRGGKSTILGMIPRISTQGETGRIFYEVNNLMYVDLQNTQEIRLQNFDVSFCNVDETFATNLTGQSVVILHLRQKP
jgi:hypothetical protein